MRTRQIYILLAVFVVLGVAAYLAYQAKTPPERASAESDEGRLFPALDAENVAKIKIKSLADEATLERDDTGTWVVPDKGGYPADAKAVERMLEAVQTMDKGTVVSRNPEKQALYEVDNTLGTEVTFLDKEDNELAHFIAGKAGQDFLSSNVRLAGANEVRLVRQMLSYVFKRPDGDWREKLIFDVEEDKLVKYSISGPEATVSLIKSEQGTWSTLEPAVKELDPEELKRAVSSLAKLRASGFGDVEKEKDKFELDKPKWTIAATTQDGDELTLKVCGERSKAQFFAQRADRETVFYISKYQVDRLTKPYLQALGIEEEKPKEAKSPKSAPRLKPSLKGRPPVPKRKGE